MNKKRLVVAIVVLLILAGLTILMGTRTSNSDGKMHVTTTFYPLYDFTQHVGGDKITVSNVTPASSEPHEYEPSPQQLIAAQKSGVFIYGGATLEPWVEKFLPEYKGTVVKGSSSIELRRDAQGLNPHYWLDPVLAQQVINAIRDGLGKADPVNAQYYTQQAAQYNAKLEKLNKDIVDGLATCKHRTVITSHDAFGYFAARYNLKIVPIAGLSPEQEPTAAKLAELTDLIKREDISYVFFESLVGPKLAETLAHETGAKTAILDTIEGLTDEAKQQGKDYIGLQRENLANLRAALACQ